jgi:catechol 2,3-dioxygenase-like lactoylglutathione lyase family enzyme
VLLIRIISVWLLAALPAAAQRGTPNVTFGNIVINSADPAKSVAFWVDVIGMSTWSRGSLNGVSTLGALFLITPAAPSGPSAGSAIDHIGFKVPDLQAFVDKLAKTSYKSFRPTGDQLMIDGPDGVRVELAEDSSMYAPVEFDHIHFYTTRPADLQAWYAKVFGARPGGADQPNTSSISGVRLAVAHAESVSPTAGRAIDRIAFDIRNLESFCKKLAADGIKFDSPYQVLPDLKISAAFLTDPAGARIELTEGFPH